MICGPCKLGGHFLQEARRAPYAVRITNLTLAKAKHAECVAPDNCPCHHRVELDQGKVIQ